MVLVRSLEGAFSNNLKPVAGDQIVFGRVRIKIASIPTTGDYKVYTPFGVFDFPGLAQGDKLFFTTDVGLHLRHRLRLRAERVHRAVPSAVGGSRRRRGASDSGPGRWPGPVV
jgi:hypothetical protein